jgi:hypothetical protein
MVVLLRAVASPGAAALSALRVWGRRGRCGGCCWEFARMTGFPIIDAILIFGALGIALVFGVLAVFPPSRFPEDGE